jgi:DNA mismatch endonuclease (patch repair protein)
VVLPKYHAVIFVNGCFWHCHECLRFRWPATRREFWHRKLVANRDRDHSTVEQLLASGWRVAVVWECSLRAPSDPTAAVATLEHWLLDSGATVDIAA